MSATLALWPQVVASGSPVPVNIADDEKFLGGKAVGFLRLPIEWVPKFVVLTAPFHSSVLRHTSAAAALRALPGPEGELITSLLATVSSQRPSGHIMVRSNAPGENLSSRGAYLSIAAEPTVEAVALAIDEVIRSSHPDPMCLVLQEAVEPGVQGHMSNERRVTQKHTRWLVEGLSGGGLGPSGVVIEAGRTTPTAHQLDAPSEAKALECLRTVATHLGNKVPFHIHCEWVWNARRLWIVQCDNAAPATSPRDGEVDKYLRAKGESPTTFSPRSSMVHFTAETSDQWRKLKRPKTFATLGLPAADVFIVSGATWSRDESRRGVEADISDMCRINPVVVRCDVSAEAATGEILLPTSQATQDERKLFGFMEDVCKQFSDRDVSPADWAFLLSFLVPARASAMVHARPKAERVRVDTNWGFPDGLSFFPHDSWFYYPADGRAIEKRRFKGLCLLLEESGSIPRHVGAPFDWRAVLNSSEVATVATWALRLANHLDREVQLMALARIGNTRGPVGCLPWHYTTEEVPRYSESLRMLPPRSMMEVIGSWEDLHRLRRSAPRPNLRGYYVRPGRELLRDTSFLKDAAALARSRGRPIYFEGSLLGHAYFILAEAGAAVVPVNDEEPDDAGKQYNKLVRDKIPLVIQRAGGLARVRHVAASEARALLKQKLIEEAFEVRNCSDSELVEELADVLEVVESLRAHNGIDHEELDRVRVEKRAKRGGFDQAVYLESTGLQSLRLPSDTDGLLPLFHADEAPPSERRRLAAQSHVVEKGTGDEGCLVRLAISLVPPVNDNERPAVVVVETLDATIEVRYAGSKAIVSVLAISEEQVANQLSLFDDQVGGQKEPN